MGGREPTERMAAMHTEGVERGEENRMFDSIRGGEPTQGRSVKRLTVVGESSKGRKKNIKLQTGHAYSGIAHSITRIKK